jgi:hypothetical protein
MGKDITIVIHAIFQSQNDSEQISPAVAHLRHELEITTETDVIIVPIEADIATADEYHKMFRGNLEAGKTPKTRVLAATPSNSTQPKIRLTNLSDEE